MTAAHDITRLALETLNEEAERFGVFTAGSESDDCDLPETSKSPCYVGLDGYGPLTKSADLTPEQAAMIMRTAVQP